MNIAIHEQRMTYLVLTDEVFTCLCSFCNYYQGTYCDSAECTHPLIDRLNDDGMEPGTDCWGFRPALSLSDTADIVGIILNKKWREWLWGIKNGQLIVRGH